MSLEEKNLIQNSDGAEYPQRPSAVSYLTVPAAPALKETR